MTSTPETSQTDPHPPAVALLVEQVPGAARPSPRSRPAVCSSHRRWISWPPSSPASGPSCPLAWVRPPAALMASTRPRQHPLTPGQPMFRAVCLPVYKPSSRRLSSQGIPPGLPTVLCAVVFHLSYSISLCSYGLSAMIRYEWQTVGCAAFRRGFTVHGFV